MPVERVPAYALRSSDVPSDLVARLASEIKGSASFEVDAPYVREEATPFGTMQVTVMWDKWRDLSHEDRGKVITQAYLEASGPTEALKITVALGLTHEEARKLGVRAGLG